MKNKLVLFGAFDRYNYGDNLMPILLTKYLEQYEPEKLEEYDIIYSSINSSDLSNYACYPTKSISDITSDLRAGDVIIVVGGEVLCATNAVLFLHMPKPKLLNDVYTKLNKLPIVRKVFKKWADIQYRAPWDYPYLPDHKTLPEGVSIRYNTVGGGLNNLPIKDKAELTARLKNADYISVRDSRTMNNLSSVTPVKLYPDSAFIMSDLCPEEFLSKNIRNEIFEYAKSQYFVFQAAPSKLGDSVKNLVIQLKDLHRATSKKILLLPIGYAAGHDDFYILEKIRLMIPDIADIKFELNIWEMMYLIKHSDGYIGTSLHGVITAMSFGRPHFGINPAVKKLDAFLKNWSFSPFNRSYFVSDISTIPSMIKSQDNCLIDNSRKIVELVKENNKKLFELNLKSVKCHDSIPPKS